MSRHIRVFHNYGEARAGKSYEVLEMSSDYVKLKIKGHPMYIFLWAVLDDRNHIQYD